VRRPLVVDKDGDLHLGFTNNLYEKVFA